VVNSLKELFVTQKTVKKEILRSIRRSLLKLGSATKVELSQALEISFPTISKFLGEMEKDGEIVLVGLDESSGGRRAKRYKYNPEHMLGLAIFLEKSETNYIIFNCIGEVKEQGKVSSVLINDGLPLLTSCVDSLLNKFPKIKSLAIGVPGSVDRGRILFIPGYEHLQNFDIKGYYEDYFSIPVVVENDMNAAVLGYNNKLGSENGQSLIYLYLGQNGPGAGIMLNGNVVRGSTSFSGEISFVPLYDDRNFGKSLENESGPKKRIHIEENVMDAISRLVASFVAIINPHTIIFSHDEIKKEMLNKIAICSSKYIPLEYLPELTTSDLKKDYLFGLQSLGLELMIND
jgi:ROK family